jgi:hypothetical protein
MGCFAILTEAKPETAARLLPFFFTFLITPKSPRSRERQPPRKLRNAKPKLNEKILDWKWFVVSINIILKRFLFLSSKSSFNCLQYKEAIKLPEFLLRISKQFDFMDYDQEESFRGISMGFLPAG